MIRHLRTILAAHLRRRLGLPTLELALRRLARARFKPALICDVGASYGAFVDEARKVWADVSMDCFEPEPEYVKILGERRESDRRIEVCPYLVGATCADEREYYFHLGASSVLPSGPQPMDIPASSRAMRRARMITLDSWYRARSILPAMLKIDVQGYELEVLRGATNVLPAVEVILTEINYIEIYEGAPLAAEIVEWLAHQGYALHDVFNFMPRPSDGALWQSDMLFVRHESPIRASKAW